MITKTLKGALNTLLNPLRCLLNTIWHCMDTEGTYCYSWTVCKGNRRSPLTAEQTRQECLEWLGSNTGEFSPLELAMGYPAIYLVKNSFRIHNFTADEIEFLLKRKEWANK